MIMAHIENHKNKTKRHTDDSTAVMSELHKDKTGQTQPSNEMYGSQVRRTCVVVEMELKGPDLFAGMWPHSEAAHWKDLRRLRW